MLVLSRRLGEKILIGEEVSITLLAVRGNQVRLGVDAPKHIAVHREEIFNRIHNTGESNSEINSDSPVSET